VSGRRSLHTVRHSSSERWRLAPKFRVHLAAI
jgi:hypothetical protein